MSLLNIFCKAGETVVMVDSRDRIYSELQENFIINEYEILYVTLKKDSVLECDALMMNWESAVQAGKRMAFFIRIEDADMHHPELDTLMNKVYESVKKSNSGRINFVFNNFSSLPAIQSLPNLDEREQFLHVYLFSAQSKERTKQLIFEHQDYENIKLGEMFKIEAGLPITIKVTGEGLIFQTNEKKENRDGQFVYACFRRTEVCVNTEENSLLRAKIELWQEDKVLSAVNMDFGIINEPKLPYK